MPYTCNDTQPIMKVPKFETAENLLLIPIGLFALAATQSNGHTIDIHVHDTYFVLAASWTIFLLLGLTTAIFILFKLIRRRHHSIPGKWVTAFLWLTMGLTGALILMSVLLDKIPIGCFGYPPGDLQKVLLYSTLLKIFLFSLLGVYLFFLVRCIIRLAQPALPH